MAKKEKLERGLALIWYRKAEGLVSEGRLDEALHFLGASLRQAGINNQPKVFVAANTLRIFVCSDISREYIELATDEFHTAKLYAKLKRALRLLEEIVEETIPPATRNERRRMDKKIAGIFREIERQAKRVP